MPANTMQPAAHVDAPWREADRAYQLHHFRCRFCISAGMAPGKQPRCADGQQLWDAYRVACDPRAARKSIADYVP